MPFHIQPLREFLVRPALPASLSRMGELAYNLLWSWEPVIRSVFRRLDPVLWRDSGYNPVLMLGRVSQATLEKAAVDPRFVGLYRTACEIYDIRVKTSRPADGKLIAYFSAEYGLTECLPVYSGGLGILSGDHLKSSSNQDFPLIGLGLLYQQGYFRQMLNPDGWQQERYPMMTVKDAGGQDLKVSVKLPTGDVHIQVWKLEVGRITLYLLDTNIPENQLPQDRDITDSLYGGDIDTRIRQEIVLGIGGMRALQAMGLKPTGGGADQRHLHHPHTGAGRYRFVRTGPDVPLLFGLLRGGGNRFPATHGAGAPQRQRPRRTVLHGGAGAEHIRIPERGEPASP